MSDESLSQSEIFLYQAATCKISLQVRAEGRRAEMREIEQYTMPEE
jgi:hypothetical protein